MGQVFTTDVQICAPGGMLAGRIHRSVDNLTQRQPGLLASGSWLTVKEQMAGHYAKCMAALGYTVLTFDFSGWGESGGDARQIEMPDRKIEDIMAAARFMRTLACVSGPGVGYLAICASAMYASAAIARGAPITSFASIAGWFHDSETVAAYYGGMAGVLERIDRSRQALKRFRESGADSLVPAYEEGNQRAGMFIHLDYYANMDRGRIPEWTNAMSEQSWAHWLAFDGRRDAERLSVPTLFVHGDECALPDNVRRIHERLPAGSQLIWHPGAQIDYYDREDLVQLSAAAAHEHFRITLR